MSANGDTIGDWRTDELTPELVRDGMLELERENAATRREIDTWGARADIRIRNWEEAFKSQAILIARHAAEEAAERVYEKVTREFIELRREAREAVVRASEAKGAADASGQWAQVALAREAAYARENLPLSDGLSGAPEPVRRWFRKPKWIVTLAVILGGAVAAGVEAYRAAFGP